MRVVYCFLFLLPVLSFGQGSPQRDGARLKLNLKKLNFLGSVLYVAAHPDDENTRIITSMANDRLAATAYLSMTRGDGGQNLIGPELRDELGVIRTQELLAARRIDGGQQFFTRAIDFGFSKSATETFRIWGKDEILADVVKVYRQFQPDIIITRFPPDERAGHGHHTASAMLAQEAFDVAASAEAFPIQVKEFGIWQPKRLYTNTGRWWNTSINERTPGIITLDIGRYSPLLGESFSELAAVSRSQHKSQGFGSRGTRGYQPEFLEHEKGERAEKDIFEGVNTTWTRLNGGETVQRLVEKAILEFDVEKPARSIPALLQIRTAIQALRVGVWRTRKLQEVEQLILDCAGLFIEVGSDQYKGTPGEKVSATIEVVNRSGVDSKLERIVANEMEFDSTLSQSLDGNVAVLVKIKKSISKSKAYSGPYWLKEKHGIGLYVLDDANLIGKAESDPAISFVFTVSIEGTPLTISRPMVYKSTDPVKGELTRPFEIVPPVFVTIIDPVIIFNSTTPREVNVKVVSTGKAFVKGSVRLELPAGWRTEPISIPVELSKAEEEQIKSFLVFPAQQEGTFSMKASIEVNGRLYDLSVKTLDYDHIPVQTLMPKAESRIVQLDLKKEGNVIGYITGAGDEIPAALRKIGYEVWEMKNEDIKTENLKRLDAVVLGIRALNTNERLRFVMNDLLEYVKSGGTMVVQYNTNNGLLVDQFSPFPLTLSRDRVTEEAAEVRILNANHPVLNYPNKITPKDFEGWEQERGLYFPSAWDENFEAILSMNDSEEAKSPKDGSLLVARYGSGYYIYTGLSFFRELPEGVAGAYKLFANMVSLGQVNKTAVSGKAKKTKSKK
ncbi:MAG: PIG-L family deacetylase [Cyclobacteriaceae bacterium]|nr:PIG-L family deacetylase [Cyclobacteriaceae bacterium]